MDEQVINLMEDVDQSLKMLTFLFQNAKPYNVQYIVNNVQGSKSDLSKANTLIRDLMSHGLVVGLFEKGEVVYKITDFGKYFCTKMSCD